MGDYNNQLCFNANGGDYGSIVISNEYSANGQYSAKIRFNGNRSAYVRYSPDADFRNNLFSKTIKFTANIKTSIKLEFAVYYQLNGSYVAHKVNVPENSDGVFEVTVTIPENVTALLFSIDSRTFPQYAFDVYTDNWCLNIIG